MEFDQLSNRVIGCALQVHRTLGPGLLESTYEHCMTHGLSQSSITLNRLLVVLLTPKGLNCVFERFSGKCRAQERVRGTQWKISMKMAHI